MNKNRNLFFIFVFFFFCLTFLGNAIIKADVASSANFDVKVGNKGWIKTYHSKTADETNNEYTRNFFVEVNPNLEVDLNLQEVDLPQFKWFHEMCFVVNGIPSSECEIDEVEKYSEKINGINVEKKITPNSKLSTHFFTDKSKLPYYYQGDLSNVTITFKNKFVCQLNCDGYQEEQILNEITLNLDEKAPELDINNSILYNNDTQVGEEVEIKLLYVDSKSGIDEDSLKYVWTTGKQIITFDDINIPYVNGEIIKYRPPHISYLNKTIEATFWILAYDNAGNSNFIDNGNGYTLLDARTYIFTIKDADLIYNEESIFPINGLYDNEINLNVDITNENLDVNRLYYLWSTSEMIQINDVNEVYINNESLSFKPKVNYLTYNKDVIQTYYFYIVGYDFDGNYFYQARKYDVKIEKLIMQIDENSNLPISEDYFKTITLNFSLIDGSAVIPSTIKYRWSYNDSILLSNVTLEYTGQITTPIDLTTGPVHLYISGLDIEENIYQLVLKYNFDFTKPTITDISGVDNKVAHQNVVAKVSFTDSHSGINEERMFYLWTKQNINESNYTLINQTYTTNGSLSPAGLEGNWKVYFLVYDNLENYNFGYINYIFDNTPPIVKAEISRNQFDVLSRNHGVYLEIEDNKETTFNCGWFKQGVEVTDFNDLNQICENKEYNDAPIGIEGTYFLWFYLIDQVNNDVLVKSTNSYLIDSKKPTLTYQISSDNLNYSSVNSILVFFDDGYGIDETSLKYGWFKKDLNVTSSENLNKSFINNETINYPYNYYGIYRLWISGEDVVGNHFFAPLEENFYIDTAVINLFLKGEESVRLIKGQEYVESGAIAYKGTNSIDGRVVDLIISGEVNTDQVGTYIITYTSGSGENMVSVERIVVVDEASYYFILIGISLFFGLGTYIYQLFKKRKHSLDNDINNIL